MKIATSVLDCKDRINGVLELNGTNISYVHIDVMDGKFVEQDTTKIMHEYLGHIKQISNLPLDVHLMVEDVKSYIDSFIPYEPNIITFHLEACKDREEVLSLIKYIKENNIKVGISIKPNTKVEEILEYLPLVHLVLIMTVEPGYGGQKLIPETIEKVKALNDYIMENNIEIDIEVDGGINLENKELLKEAGANIIVAGSSIINSKDYKATIENIKE